MSALVLWKAYIQKGNPDITNAVSRDISNEWNNCDTSVTSDFIYIYIYIYIWVRPIRCVGPDCTVDRIYGTAGLGWPSLFAQPCNRFGADCLVLVLERGTTWYAGRAYVKVKGRHYRLLVRADAGFAWWNGANRCCWFCPRLSPKTSSYASGKICMDAAKSNIHISINVFKLFNTHTSHEWDCYFTRLPGGSWAGWPKQVRHPLRTQSCLSGRQNINFEFDRPWNDS